ncbi:hypothetical protein SHVI106290_08855 [Shewanella violacea]
MAKPTQVRYSHLYLGRILVRSMDFLNDDQSGITSKLAAFQKMPGVKIMPLRLLRR